jgi:hypothetical protein
MKWDGLFDKCVVGMGVWSCGEDGDLLLVRRQLGDGAFGYLKAEGVMPTRRSINKHRRFPN